GFAQTGLFFGAAEVLRPHRLRAFCLGLKRASRKKYGEYWVFAGFRVPLQDRARNLGRPRAAARFHGQLGSIFAGVELPLLVKSERILAEAVFFAILVLMMGTTFTVGVSRVVRGWRRERGQIEQSLRERFSRMTFQRHGGSWL